MIRLWSAYESPESYIPLIGEPSDMHIQSKQRLIDWMQLLVPKRQTRLPAVYLIFAINWIQQSKITPANRGERCGSNDWRFDWQAIVSERIKI